ncbi:MAG: ABC transporter ATP-binding protein [Acidobacteria bacterium]|nr:ABC transporter ATP-binding protein [Acidobacteriota bacterium]
MIEVTELVKKYGALTAVNAISFNARRGEVLGLLGPNGAGKTSTLRMICGFTRPTSGTCRVDGIDVGVNPLDAKRRTGYLPENLPLYPEMTVTEYLTFVAGVREVPGRRLRAAVESAVTGCGLEPVRHRVIRNISRGFRQRTGLAQALIHEPGVLVLDEPTIGLDPVSILDVRALIRRMAGKGTVVLSTHLLHEAELLCDRLLIMDGGSILAEGPPAELVGRASGPLSCECLLEGEREVVEAILESDSLFRGFSLDAGSEGLWRCRFDIAEAGMRAEIVRHILDAELKLCGFRLLKPTLEEVFRAVMDAKPAPGTVPAAGRGGGEA